MEKLKALGLNEYERKVYLTLVEMGSGAVSLISQKSGVPLGKIYAVLENLENAGLVRLIGESPKRYRAVKPRIGLKGLLKKKEREWKRKKGGVLEFIESLEVGEELEEPVSIFKSREVFYEELKENLAGVEEERLDIAHDLREIVAKDTIKRKMKEGVDFKLIVPFRDEIKERVKEAAEMGIEIKSYPIHGLRLGINDKKETLLAIVDPSLPYERLSLAIRNERFTESMRKFFKAIWKQADPISFGK